MADTNFTNYVTPVDASWLNDVNDSVYTTTPAAIATKEAIANKSTSVATDQASDIKFPSVKAVYDWCVGLFLQITGTTGSAKLPSGTTAQRDGTPAVGYTRFNTSYGKPEVWNGTAWSGLGGADGNGGDAVFYVNDSVVNTAYTLPTNKNAMCAGPITFNAAVTVPSGSRLTVV